MEECAHPLIFHYGNGLAFCSECSEQIVTLKDGGQITLADLVLFFEEATSGN